MKLGVVVAIDLPASGDHGGGPFAGDRGRHGPGRRLRRGDLEVDRTGRSSYRDDEEVIEELKFFLTVFHA